MPQPLKVFTKNLTHVHKAIVWPRTNTLTLSWVLRTYKIPDFNFPCKILSSLHKLSIALALSNHCPGDSSSLFTLQRSSKRFVKPQVC